MIWELGEFSKDKLAAADIPMLLSWSMDVREPQFQRSILKLKKIYSDRSEEVLFRNPDHVSQWKYLNDVQTQEWEFAERILIT